jgi:hypothetical protein
MLPKTTNGSLANANAGSGVIRGKHGAVVVVVGGSGGGDVSVGTCTARDQVVAQAEKAAKRLSYMQ